MVSACNNQAMVAQAPIVPVGCGEVLPINRGGYMGEMSFLVDVAIAFTHLVLAARAEGLGTCWIGSFKNEEVKKVLQIPKGFEVAAITPLGYPATDAFSDRKTRKSPEEVVAIDEFTFS